MHAHTRVGSPKAPAKCTQPPPAPVPPTPCLAAESEGTPTRAAAVPHDFATIALLHTGGAAPGDAAPLPVAEPDEAPSPEPEPGRPGDESSPGSRRVVQEAGHTPQASAPSAPSSPKWSRVSGSGDLWHFCGERPAGFATTARLRATGFPTPSAVTWQIVSGPVAFRTPAAGQEVEIESTGGSSALDDVAIEASAGVGAAALTFTGRLTVRRPNRLVPVSTSDSASCPTWGRCPATCPTYWSQLGYRVEGNFSRVVKNVSVNERFPGKKADDVPNDWADPAVFTSVPYWNTTSGTFIDNWYVFCGSPSPVAPTAPNAGSSVDHMPHEFFVGSTTPGRGCRVQAHTAHRYLGWARHEGITSPAP